MHLKEQNYIPLICSRLRVRPNNLQKKNCTDQANNQTAIGKILVQQKKKLRLATNECHDCNPNKNHSESESVTSRLCKWNWLKTMLVHLRMVPLSPPLYPFIKFLFKEFSILQVRGPTSAFNAVFSYILVVKITNILAPNVAGLLILVLMAGATSNVLTATFRTFMTGIFGSWHLSEDYQPQPLMSNCVHPVSSTVKAYRQLTHTRPHTRS